MNAELRIVIVEDVQAEAVAVEQALSKNGLVFQLQRVDTREAFLRELEAGPPDIILSDHGLPSFNGFAALAVARVRCPNVPFIFVTNALTREMEIEKLSPGVTDFVLKSRLDDLAPIIRHALNLKEELPASKMTREERERIVRRLLALLAEYGPGTGYLPICASCKKIRDKENRWHVPEGFFRKHLSLNFTHGLCPDCLHQYHATFDLKSK